MRRLSLRVSFLLLPHAFLFYLLVDFDNVALLLVE